jgi:murein DD-endopeptidase MepM/ murein hydrolase activator NlpD
MTFVRRICARAVAVVAIAGLVAAACAARRPVTRYGVYHTVAAGENLYRIAVAYGVDVEALRRANRLRDPDRIDAGRKIFVPGARWPRDVGPAPAPEAPARTDGVVLARPTDTSIGPERLPVRLTRPLQGTVTSGFGMRDGVPHTGIDIRAPAGTPVGAAADGTVKWTGEIRGYGRTVIVDHGEGVATVYAHLSEILVEPGDSIGRTEPIGRVGDTGRASAPHLHLEVRLDGTAVDPLRYLP